MNWVEDSSDWKSALLVDGETTLARNGRSFLLPFTLSKLAFQRKDTQIQFKSSCKISCRIQVFSSGSLFCFVKEIFSTDLHP
ncbi:hypothetical protein CEXT_129201 [Caerostris extrusa]|uniref:Uncharacterized protein n=1 Tax=Caerostris extrusa TaxID=172846 RepID=A0AAV4XY09_CAEEX|nr:hypothetical protein CEXT_129201 [Caerostris extrusa]